MEKNRTAFLGLAAAGVLGCSSDVEVNVQLVDPCNQQAVSAVDFIRIEPRGSGLASGELTTIERVGATETAPIEVPLVEDFHLVATGHRPSFDAPASALGVSSPVDLSAVDDSIQIQVPFALLGRFYRTTNLAAPEGASDRCSALRQGRFGATATVLPSGQVLIVGGARYESDSSGTFLEFPRLVEVYDPASGLFLDGPPGTNRKWELRTGQPRRNHTASLLPDGRVLIAGGRAPDQNPVETALRSAFIIDPRDLNNLQISEGGIPMMMARTGHRASVLADGRVVLVGGRTLNPSDPSIEAQTYLDSVEIFDPAAGGFLLATGADGNAVTLSAPRAGHTAAALPTSTDVLVAGGLNRTGPVTGVEVLRFSAGGVLIVQSTELVGVGPMYHAASITADGAVLLSGGYSTLADLQGPMPANSVASVEMWSVDPASGAPRRVCTASLLSGRGFHTSSVIGGRAVFVGGRGPNGRPRADGEVAPLLSITEATRTCFGEAPGSQAMNDARAEHAAVVLPSSREVLILGGVQQDPVGAMPGVSTGNSELFSDFGRRAILGETAGP